MQPGDRIKNYVVIGEAGRGGMGIVYRARDETLDRDVAIKVLPEALAFNPERMARFEREAKLLASLNHPNIATIYGLEQQDKQAYLVMEFVEKETLAARTQEGRIPWEEAVPIALQIVSAIEYAHNKGVIHRDLKPANVKFDRDGNAKVLDFGLAKAMTEQSSEVPLSGSSSGMDTLTTLTKLAGSSREAGSTVPGALIGTIGYASPEQTRGRELDQRTDIFSFGCVLFEMLASGPPFPADTAVDGIGKTLHKEPEWSQLPGSLPPRLTLLLRRCLAKDRKHRLCDIGDARLELSELREHQDLVEGPVATEAEGGGLLWMVVAFVGVIAAFFFAGLYLFNQPELAPVIEDQPAFVTHRSITIPEDLNLGIFSSEDDDEYLRVVCRRDIPSVNPGAPPKREWRLYVRPRDSDELREIHYFTGYAGFSFSPDGESYVLNYGGRVLRGRIDSTVAPIELARVPDAHNAVGGFNLFPAKRGAIWFDDDTIIIETRDDKDETQLVLVDAKTGDIKKNIPLKLKSKELRLDGLIGRFDDDHVLMYVSLYNDEGFSINLATASLTTGELDVLVERAGDAEAVGEHLFFTRGDSLYMATYDPKTHKLIDAGEPVMQGMHTIFGSHASFDITDNGTLVYKPGGMQASKRQLMVNTGEGPQPTGLPDAPYDNGLSVSGDGSRISVTRLRPDGMWEIWGGTFDPPRMRKVLAENDADYCYPILSYDGSILGCAQIATTAEGVEISFVVVPVDGSKPKKVLWNFSGENEISFNSFSLDNQRILADMRDSDGVGEQRRLVEIDIETGEVIELLSRVGGAMNGLWSPDGTMISFKAMETGVPELHVYNPKTKEEALVSHLPVGIQRWVEGPDGALSLLYWDNQWRTWESPIALDANGGFVIGEAVERPYTPSEIVVAFNLDNRGGVYTIEPGENDGSPNHLVVIENWLDTVRPQDG